MKASNFLFSIVACGALVAFMSSGCGKGPPATGARTLTGPTSAAPGQPAALPENGFKASITMVDPPAKLRAGEKITIQVNVKNSSDVLWYARGAEINNSSDNKFYLAAGNRWLNAADQKLVTDMDGRYGLNKDLRPGEETNVPLAVTAPKDAGNYILEVDLVQEQVAWFHDKGSPTARINIRVER